MSKSKNKNASEVQFLKGKIRKLEAEVKFLKRRQHISVEELLDEEELKEVDAYQCPSCRSGILVSYDFNYVVVSKCNECSFEKRQKKKGQ